VELFGSSLRAAGWIAVGAVWMISLVSSWRSQSLETAAESTTQNSDLFRRAQREYLKGNWFEAESILSGRLKAQASDPEARLLLATLLRHTKRHKEAREQLAQLERLDAANRWNTEIAAEKAALLAAAPNLETMLSEKLSQLQAAAAVGTKASQAA
jgi:thioredoxin-like negative regulator of GroEL